MHLCTDGLQMYFTTSLYICKYVKDQVGEESNCCNFSWSKTNDVLFSFQLYFQQNYPYVWANSWLKELIEDPRVRPYGFPPVLWIALGHQQTVVLHQEWVDPLCRYMMMCCSPIDCLDHQEVVSCDSQGYDWQIYGLIKSYTESIKRKPAANRGMEMRDNFNTMQGYRQRPEISPNMSTLPLYMSALSRQDAVQLNGYKGLLSLTQKANSYQYPEEEAAAEEEL